MVGRTRGFELFEVRGIRVTADWSWLLVLLLVTWSLATGYFPQVFMGESAATYWTMGLVSALLLFGSVLAHEFGHALVAIQNGIRILGIRLFVFGGIAQMEREPHRPEVELKVALAGPAVSAGLAALFYLLSYAEVSVVGAPFVMAALFLARANLVMALFNLIPGFPLDGGRVLRALLWQAHGSYFAATQTAARAGTYVSYGFMGLGVLAVLFGAFVSGLWLGLIGLFLYQAARSAQVQVEYERVAPRRWLEPDPSFSQLERLMQEMLEQQRRLWRRFDPFGEDDWFDLRPRRPRRIRLHFD